MKSPQAHEKKRIFNPGDLVQYCRLTGFPRQTWEKVGIVVDSVEGRYSEVVQVYWIENRETEIISSPWLDKSSEVPDFTEE